VINLEKIVKALDKATDLLAEAIRSGADKTYPSICTVQQILLETLIDLCPSYGL